MLLELDKSNDSRKFLCRPLHNDVDTGMSRDKLTLVFLTDALWIRDGREAVRFLGTISYANARLRSSASTTSSTSFRHHHVHQSRETPTVGKAAVDKKATEEAAVAAAAIANWPTVRYNTFIPLLFIAVWAVIAVCIDVSTICLVYDIMIKYQYVSIVYVMLMIYF